MDVKSKPTRFGQLASIYFSNTIGNFFLIAQNRKNTVNNLKNVNVGMANQNNSRTYVCEKTVFNITAFI